MELVTGLSVGLLVYLAFVFDVMGFLARDELLWRGLMLAASAFYLVYYYVVADLPLWDALITNGILAVVNLMMIGVVAKERSTLGMNRATLDLYRRFPLLTPGQFRRLLQAATPVTADRDTTLVVAGNAPAHLFYMLEGPVEIVKNGTSTPIDPGIFIAEIAYLTGSAATATVRVRKGARYLKWEAAALRRLLVRKPGLNAALIANLNMDLAHKVARSQPVGLSEGKA